MTTWPASTLTPLTRMPLAVLTLLSATTALQLTPVVTPDAQGFRDHEHAMSAQRAFCKEVNKAVNSIDKKFPASMKAQFADDATAIFPGNDGVNVRLTGPDDIANHFESQWMMPMKSMHWKTIASVSSNFSLIAYGTAYGKTRDGCAYKVDAMVEMSYVPGKITTWNNVVDPRQVPQQCGYPTPQPLSYLQPFADTAAGRHYVDAYWRGATQEHRRGPDDTPFRLRGLYATTGNFSMGQRNNAATTLHTRDALWEYIVAHWHVTTTAMTFSMPHIVMANDDTVMFIMTAAGVTADGRDVYIPMAGVFEINRDRQIEDMLTVYGHGIETDSGTSSAYGDI